MTLRQLFVTLKIPRTVLGLLLFAKGVKEGFTDNELLPKPPVPLPTLADHIKAFEDSHVLVTARLELTTERDVHEQQLRTDLEAYRAYTQTMARAQPTMVDGAALVAGAHMSLRKPRKRVSVDFAVKSVGLEAVQLTVKQVARDATHYWQFSLDGVNWVSAPETIRVSTTIWGLEQYKRHYFRVRRLTRKGFTEWCEPVPFTVL